MAFDVRFLFAVLGGWGCILALAMSTMAAHPVCNDGLYWSEQSNQCVIQCPCGYYADVIAKKCSNGSDSNDLTFFNQTEYELHSLPINVSAGTKLGTTWISLPLQLLEFNDSHLDPLSSVYINIDFKGVILDSSPIPLLGSATQFYIDLEIAGQVVTKNGSGWMDMLQLSVDDVIACGEYVLLPINLLAGSGFAGVGINQFSMFVYFYHDKTESLHLPDTQISFNVFSVCSSEQYYLTVTGQCVSQCPCGTTTYPEFCDEATDQVIMISPGIKGLEFDPQTPKGTLISMYTIYFDISDGSPLHRFNESGVMEMSVQSNAIKHVSNEDPSSSSSQFLYYYHYYKTQFTIQLPGMENATALVREVGPIDAVFPENSSTVETCLRAGSKFLVVPVEVYLSSPFFYQLGLHWLSLKVAISQPNEYLGFVDNNLFININADCPDHLQYDFNSGECVGECPCGFIGFDYNLPAYCEPAPAEPAWDQHSTHEDERSPARFADTAYFLPLVWNDPPVTATAPVKVFVYLNLTRLYGLYPSLKNDSVIVALVEVQHIESSPVTAGDAVDGTPVLELSGPPLPDSVKGTSLNSSSTKLNLILKNSSQYGLEYCYDELQDRLVGYIPITVTVISPQQYSLLANHTFALRMTFSVMDGISLPIPADTMTFTVSVEAGDLGQTPFPNRMEPLVAGRDYYPFIDVKGLDYLMLESTLDGASDIIATPIGLPFGTAVHTKAYVGVNGIISFGDKWHFWQPSRFPTTNPWSRRGCVVAPFWSDNDLRTSGAVHYATVEGMQGEALLRNVSDFIQRNHETAEADQFEGLWMLVVHWDEVHPYPHGSSYSAAVDDYDDYIHKKNSYQAIVITDGADSYALFTYNCHQMEWTGYWQHGVVGYNAEGEFYDNHPASGFEVVNNSIACANDMYGSPWSNVLYKISLAPDYQLKAKRNCLMMIRKDEERLQSIGNNVQESLEPCPCSVWQAEGDFGRFQKEGFNGTCYVQRFPLRVNAPEGEAFFSQECCYSSKGDYQFGSLLLDGSYAGTILSYHPILNYSAYVTYDKTLKDTCCTAGLCHEFLKLRPPQNCSGYVAPKWAWGYGDPHITTLDGRSYTFNGWGEYVMLEYTPQNSISATFVIQAKTAAVNLSNSNPATKLSAIAFGIPEELSFQVGIKDDSFYVFVNASGLLEDVTASLTNSDFMYSKTNGLAELVRTADDSVEAAFSNGAGLAISTTGDMLSFILSLSSSFAGRTNGLLGNYNENVTDEFIPRYENSSLASDIPDREIHMFGETWAVMEEETLFFGLFAEDDEVASVFPDYQPVFVDEFVPSQEQVQVCGGHHLCAYDYAQTGKKEVGLMTKTIQSRNAENEALLDNYPPRMVGESVFRITVDQLSVYEFYVVDSDGDNFSVGIVDDPLMSSFLIKKSDGVFEFQLTLREPTDLSLTFIATDSFNGSSTLSPRLEVCACANGGECSLEGLLNTDAATHVMNCICPPAFDGKFCEEDRNGCLDNVCYEKVECQDLPAPWVGAECGSCPPGLTGIVEDQYKCLDINECASNQSGCEQHCVNKDGGYDCTCWPGFLYDNASEKCVDIDECLGAHGCQQICNNNQGSYTCHCTQGFQLAADGKSCNVVDECAGNVSCSQICAAIGSEELCYCSIGYGIDNENGSYCFDVNECELYSPCDQECTNLPGSFECSCGEGYELNEDGVTCTDVNECLVEALYFLDLCVSHTTCVNLEGSYTCTCAPGYSFLHGSCQLKTELPEVLQVFPSTAAENAVLVIVTGLLPYTFTPDKKQEFRSITADLVNNYCLSSICDMKQLDRRRRQTMVTEPSNVAIQNFTESTEGRLLFNVYVVLEDGILSLNSLQNALRGQEHRYIGSVGNIVNIEFVGVVPHPITTSSAINFPTVSAHPSEVPVSTSSPVLVIVLVSLAAICLALLGLCVLLCCIFMRYRPKQQDYTVKSPSIKVAPEPIKVPLKLISTDPIGTTV